MNPTAAELSLLAKVREALSRFDEAGERPEWGGFFMVIEGPSRFDPKGEKHERYRAVYRFEKDELEALRPQEACAGHEGCPNTDQ